MGRLGVFLRRCHGGQGGPGITGGEKLQGRDGAPAAGLGQIPATAGVEIEARGHWKLPVIEGKLPGGLAGAEVRRSGRSTALAESLVRWSEAVMALELGGGCGSKEVGGSTARQKARCGGARR
jgi:hypothetical protein